MTFRDSSNRTYVYVDCNEEFKSLKRTVDDFKESVSTLHHRLDTMQGHLEQIAKVSIKP